MKKFTLLFLAVLIAGFAYSQNKQQTAAFLNETNVIIHKTTTLVKENQVYTGGVLKGIEFQKKAIKNFKKNKMKKAINNSYIARRLTFIAHNANSDDPILQAWHTTPVEQRWITVNIDGESLENILDDVDPDDEADADDSELDDLNSN